MLWVVGGGVNVLEFKKIYVKYYCLRPFFLTKDQIKWWKKITNKAGSLFKINFQLN